MPHADENKAWNSGLEIQSLVGELEVIEAEEENTMEYDWSAEEYDRCEYCKKIENLKLFSGCKSNELFGFSNINRRIDRGSWSNLFGSTVDLLLWNFYSRSSIVELLILYLILYR